MNVLVLNCGSSSLKYQLYDMPEERLRAKGLVQRIGDAGSEAWQKAGERELRLVEPVADHAQGLELAQRLLTHPAAGAIRSLAEIGACGHRVVHGGERFTGSMPVTDDLEKAVEAFSELAPLHNPPNLVGLRAARRLLGDRPQVACFDTAFHQTIPEVAYLYALPHAFYTRHRIRRYGFHGISHRYVARRAAVLLGRGKHDVNLITCHLGNGSSVTAVRQGRSVDTSMGLTPLEGLVMGTRTGDLDPAIVFFLVKKGYTVEELDAIFNRESGLLGLSGSTNDERDLEDQAAAGNARARLALDVFCYRLRKYIGAYLAVLNACDGIVFTGGIGENEPRIRRRVLSDLDGLGIRLDERRNAETVRREGRIDAEGSRLALLVIPTNEELAIARDTYLIATGQSL